MTTDRGYNERTLVQPRERWEVYGADGYGWYAYTTDAVAIVGRSKVTLRLSQNPTFTHMDGMTAKKLFAKGFMESEGGD